MIEGSTKEKIIQLRKQGKSYREIEKELGCSKSLISYHCKNEVLNDIGLDTSKKLNDYEIDLLKIFYKTNSIEKTMKEFGVSRSTITKYTENKRFLYDNDDDRRKSNYVRVKTFRRKTKQRAVEYKGGECSICSYNKSINALDFHHLDPKEKDFNLSANMSMSWDKIVKELDKCILVCSNCHREIHDVY
jgi:transcriptional regulator with XRE-family HTH domain